MHQFSKRKFMSLLSASALVGALFVATLPGVVSAATCSGTGYFEDGRELTAALVNPPAVTGPVVATGCDIGVYYGPDETGTVDHAIISDATYYGVLVDGGAANVINSHVYDIGDNPAFTGAQHGDAIAYRNDASGTISGNTVDHYQKTGILVTTGSNAEVLNNTVTGSGKIDYIAQNGIQISFGASAVVRGNTVSENWYTPKDTIACGLLLFEANGVKTQNNRLFDNEVNFCNFGRGGGNIKP